MQILIVEGNPAEASARLQSLGLPPYAESYATVLHAQHGAVECTIVPPTDCQQIDLQQFDGIVWTGSSLCISEGADARVQLQLALARRAYESGVPVFGSCWGIQVMCQALGGEISRCSNGREIGIARHIQVNETGQHHALFAGKPACFDALASHRDEVTRLPDGAVVLAGNQHSPVQAIAIEQGQCSFWGVQYHPEFDLQTVAALIGSRAAELTTEGFFSTPEEGAHHAEQLRQAGKNEQLAWQLGLHSSVLDQHCRQQELRNWLEYKVAAQN